MRPHFQQLYQHDDDPWQVRQRWYERRKRELLLAALPASRYRHVYEPACGNGELTAALAGRADRVSASDGSPAAVRLAQQRVDGMAHVTVQCQQLPGDWPDQTFDLIIVSELAYYFSEPALLELRDRCRDTLTIDGTLVLCHWRRPFPDRLLETKFIHDSFDACPELHRVVHHAEADFLLDVWSRNPRSVAQQEGIST
ncbi:methyltransferase domain-containing protein [Duganella sp. FT80W]|uniref:Methyltransferase domain-containing protein n=1 Tax=Duganella guangzhouensis TaxID=2666084 RepID=A0A6I2KV71_9BURK|nr:class I SAM-dependent methyltransferase [Duganella guangzhouensis]MRW89703.1 methyltransferase domain-containing protein [Duganella guangzhouensis]